MKLGWWWALIYIYIYKLLKCCLVVCSMYMRFVLISFFYIDRDMEIIDYIWMELWFLEKLQIDAYGRITKGKRNSLCA